MNTKTTLIFDYGHGVNCPGKCSPDKTFYEWESNRRIGKAVAAKMRELGVDVRETWVADHEPLSTPGKMCSAAQLSEALSWRVREVNKYCQTLGAKNCLSISFHSNAAGNGISWMPATGFCVMVGKKASKASKKLATSIYDAAAARGLQGNRYVPEGHYWAQSLAMCDSTKCPAVLIEALFYDNKQDLAILQSEDGQKTIVEAIVGGITKYLETI